VSASKNLYELLGELERSLFELQAFAWCVRDKESVVDVDDVAFAIDHDILVVPILYLKNVAYERVGGKRI